MLSSFYNQFYSAINIHINVIFSNIVYSKLLKHRDIVFEIYRKQRYNSIKHSWKREYYVFHREMKKKIKKKKVNENIFKNVLPSPNKILIRRENFSA